jgi:hypothetical protein
MRERRERKSKENTFKRLNKEGSEPLLEHGGEESETRELLDPMADLR